jgi:galactose mutarotase-like enzyme
MKSPLLFQNQPVIELRDETSRALISPEHGARLLRWEKEGREIVTWPENADWSQILKVRGGNPVLFPFIARHFVDGKNELWRDCDGVVRAMPQHGFARDAKFTVVEDGRASMLRLRLADSPATRAFYPFAFQFDVVFALRPGGRLEIAFETTNRGDGALPYYAGHHFYFAIPHGERAGWRLHLPCAAWGRQSPDGSIQRETPTAELLSLADPALIDRFQIGPREARVELRHKATGRALGLDLRPPDSLPWYAVTTWSQTPESDFYCIEPWLGLPNAIHHGEGLRWVGAGETERAALILDASGW